jgi:hypothetical protein
MATTMATDKPEDRLVDEPERILDAIAYVEEIHRELTTENTAPPQGALNQVVEVVLADPLLADAARAWAERNRVLDEVKSPPDPPPFDDAYRRVSDLIREVERQAGPGSDRRHGSPPNP